jgi:hypothetical protein
MRWFATLLVACSGSSSDDTTFDGAETCDNGVDDNGNGLVDESGLTFISEGSSVTIWLSLERIGPENKPVTYSRKAVITCRNT